MTNTHIIENLLVKIEILKASIKESEALMETLQDECKELAVEVEEYKQEAQRIMDNIYNMSKK